MNIQPGDTLAYIVGAILWPEMNGRIVEVVRRIEPGELYPLPNGDTVHLGLHRTCDWEIKASMPLPFCYGYSDSPTTIMTTHRPIGDAFLRPIRDLPGDDQTLAWAGKPEKVTA